MVMAVKFPWKPTTPPSVSAPLSSVGVKSTFAEAGPAISGWPPGGVADPPKATGICDEYGGSVLFAVVTVGTAVPNQFPLKSLRFVVPGAGNEPPDCRSTTSPYQLPERSLLRKVELRACCKGLLVPPEASRKSTPSVQFPEMWFATTVVLFVWFRRRMPERLSTMSLLWMLLPELALTSTPVRFPVMTLLRTSAIPTVWMAIPDTLRLGSFH